MFIESVKNRLAGNVCVRERGHAEKPTPRSGTSVETRNTLLHMDDAPFASICFQFL